MTDPMLGMMVKVVDPGTVIAKDGKGEDMVVTDSSAVVNGHRMWVTQAIWDAIKAGVIPAPQKEEK